MSFKATTSHRALILGMTNTDQVAMLHAGPPAAEVLPDVGDGASGEPAGEVNEQGLTAEEQAEFERMRSGEPPAGDEPDDGEGDGDGDGGEDGDGDHLEAEAPPVAARAEKTPDELAAEAAAGKKPAKTVVSVGKYQRDLKKARDELETQRQATQKEREDRIKLAERVAIINEALQAQAAPAPVVDPNAPPENPFEEADIDPEVDYAGAVRQLSRRQRFQNEQSSRVEQDVVESREDQELRGTFERDFQASAARDPELPAAYQFLKDSRLIEICITEFDKDPRDPEEVFTKDEVAKMVQTFNAEEKWVVSNAIKAGKSPSAAIKKLALARGFVMPKAAPPAARAAPAAPAVPAVRNGTGKPPAAPAAPSAVAALADLAAAKEASKSLSDGGGAPPGGLTAEMLLRMGDEEFADLVDQLPKHQLDALMGRAG